MVGLTSPDDSVFFLIRECWLSGTVANMSDQPENVYTELTALGGEFGKEPSVEHDKCGNPNDHDQAVLKFLKRNSEDLKRCLPIGSMIERMHSLGVITLEERKSLESKRDTEHEAHQAMAVGVLSLIESTAKSAEQRMAFLRAIEETRADGMTKAILRDIWSLLQSRQAHAAGGNDSSNVYQSLLSASPAVIYQGTATRRKGLSHW